MGNKESKTPTTKPPQDSSAPSPGNESPKSVKVVIRGDMTCGKSTFYNYLHTGQFDPTTKNQEKEYGIIHEPKHVNSSF